MQARGLAGQDVANALAEQNLITPVGTQKIGSFEYAIQLNNAPTEIEGLGDLPIKTVNGAMVYIHDVASVRRSEEHTSELQSLMRSSYAVFCLKKKKYNTNRQKQ